MSADIIREGSGDAEHEFVGNWRNWPRVVALVARGGGVECRGAAGPTIWSPKTRRRRGLAAAGGGARRAHGPVGLGEGGRAGEQQELTSIAWPWPETAGEGRRRRNGARRSRGRGGGTATIPASCGSPITCESRTRRQGSVRCFWTPRFAARCT